MAWLDQRAIPLYHTTGNHTTYDAESEMVFRQVSRERLLLAWETVSEVPLISRGPAAKQITDIPEYSQSGVLNHLDVSEMPLRFWEAHRVG